MPTHNRYWQRRAGTQRRCAGRDEHPQHPHWQLGRCGPKRVTAAEPPTSAAAYYFDGVYTGRDLNITHQQIEKQYLQAAPEFRPPLDLPEPVPYFTDRESTLAALMDKLQPEQVQTLCGPGGIGKTSLASEAIWRLAATGELVTRFPEGVLFYTFYGQPESERAFQYIANAYGEAPDGTPALAARRALSGRRALLVLDGAEDAQRLSDVLAIRGACGVLITSRNRADAEEEREDVAPLPPNHALALLQEWAAPRAGDADAARRICELVGELPLALRLVGSYLRQTEIDAAEYLNAFLAQTTLAALDRGERSHESVPLLLQRSVDRLSERSRRALGVAGLLAFSPFTAEAVAAALEMPTGHAQAALGDLVQYSLLSRPDHDYEITHRLVHTYARAQLPPDAETVDRMAQYYNRFAREHTDDFAALNTFRLHLRPVLRACHAHGAWQAIIDIAWSVNNFLDLQGYWEDRTSIIESAITASKKTRNHYSEEIWLGNLGNTYRDLGKVRQAFTCFEEALVIAREIGDRLGEGTWLGNIGLLYLDIGEVHRTIEYYEAALPIAREVGDRNGEANRLGNLGNAYLNLGKAHQAIEYYEAALSITQEIEDHRTEGYCLGALGKAYLNQGEIHKAIKFHKQALSIAQKIGDRHGESDHLNNLGNAFRKFGKFSEAIEHYEAALLIAQGIKNRHIEEIYQGNLGDSYLSLGEVHQAINYYKSALAITQELENRKHERVRLGSLGNAYRNLGEVRQAIEYYKLALAIDRKIGDRSSEAENLGNLGLSYSDLGKMQLAIGYYEDALAIAREIDYQSGEGQHLNNLGVAYRNLGEAQTARQYGEQALRIYEAIESPYAEVTRQWLEKLDR